MLALLVASIWAATCLPLKYYVRVASTPVAESKPAELQELSSLTPPYCYAASTCMRFILCACRRQCGAIITVLNVNRNGEGVVFIRKESDVRTWHVFIYALFGASVTWWRKDRRSVWLLAFVTQRVEKGVLLNSPLTETRSITLHTNSYALSELLEDILVLLQASHQAGVCCHGRISYGPVRLPRSSGLRGYKKLSKVLVR